MIKTLKPYLALKVELSQFWRSTTIFLVVLTLWMLQAKTTHESWTESSRLATIESLVERGTWRIEASPYGHETGDKLVLNGHYYSDKPPLFAAIGALFYGLMYYGWQAGLAFEGCPTGTFCVYYWLTVLMVCLPSALLVVLFERLASRYLPDSAWALGLTALLCLGSVIWPYSLVLNNHLPASAALFAAFYLLLTPGLKRNQAFCAGLLSGLAVMLDLTSIFMAAAFFLIMIIHYRQRFLFFLGAAIIPLIISMIFNYQITSTPLFPYLITEGYNYPGSVFNTLGGQRPPDNLFIYAFRTFMGDYGLLAYCPILILAFIGLIKARHFAPQTFIRETILVGLAGHVLFVLTRTHNFGGDAYGGRYFIPIIPILYFFTTFILPPSLQTVRGKWLVAVAGSLSALIALFSAYQGVQATWRQVEPPFFGALQSDAPYLSLQSNLALPHPEPTLHRPGDHVFEIPSISQQLDLDFNHEVTLLGYDLPRRRLQPGQTIDLTLYWQSRQVVPKTYFLFVHLVDAHQTRLAGFDRRLTEQYDFAFWYPGEVVVDPASLALAPDLPAGLVWLRLGLYGLNQKGEIEPLPIYLAGDHIETSLAIGPLLVGDSPQIVAETDFEPQMPLEVDLGQPPSIRLRGYDAAAPIIDGTSPGQALAELKLTLYWQSLSQSSVEWNSFVHLRNEAGEIVAQHDQPAGGGLLPSSLWQPGEMVADPFWLSLPPDLKAGTYSLVAGLYRPDTGERLPVPSSTENVIHLLTYNRE